MFQKIAKRLLVLGVFTFAIPALIMAETVGIFADNTVAQIKFAANDVKTALESKGYTVEMLSFDSFTEKYTKKKIVIATASNTQIANLLKSQGGSVPSVLGEQSYAIRTTSKGQKSYWVIGADVNGAMYGAIQIAEQIGFDGFSGISNIEESPFMLNRGMKLNMPLDRRIPTYVGGWSSNSAKKAIPHVWDITFWKKLIDQQARNRYNVLSVWVHHPFPALVKLDD